MNWGEYLPSVLQLNQVRWIIAVNVATVCALRTLPDNLRKPWLIQLGTFCISSAFSIGLLGRAGMVYAFGSAIIASSLATSFYDVAFRAIENKVRAILGSNSNTATPPTFQPGPKIENKPDVS